MDLEGRPMQARSPQTRPWHAAARLCPPRPEPLFSDDEDLSEDEGEEVAGLQHEEAVQVEGEWFREHGLTQNTEAQNTEESQRAAGSSHCVFPTSEDTHADPPELAELEDEDDEMTGEMDACQECGHSSVHGDGVAGSTGDATADSVLRILDAISKERMTVGRFLKALSWGNATCVSNGRIRNTRTAFMNSPELPRLLETWWKPPRSPNSHKSRSDAGRSVLESFAVRAVHETLQKELDLVDPLLRASEDRLTKDELTQLNLDELETDIRTRAPMLWGLFEYRFLEDPWHRRNAGVLTFTPRKVATLSMPSDSR